MRQEEIMKIAVYTICKNESAFVDRWVDSMSEADGIFVLDTGSEDDTVEKLKARGVTVGEAEIIPGGLILQGICPWSLSPKILTSAYAPILTRYSSPDGAAK